MDYVIEAPKQVSLPVEGSTQRFPVNRIFAWGATMRSTPGKWAMILTASHRSFYETSNGDRSG